MKRSIRRAENAAPARRGKRTPRVLTILAVALAVVATFVGPASAADAQATEPASVDSLMARGNRALGDGNVASAEALFSEVLSQESGEHRALCGLAIVGLIEDDPDKAIKYARKAIKKDKKNSRYHFMLANGYGMKASRGGMRAMFYGGKFKQECELALKYDPENVDAHMAVMSFYVHAPSFMGGGLEKAKETAETVASLDAYYGHIAHAMIATQEDDLVAAESSYLAAAAVDSQNAGGWSKLGAFYLDIDRFADAVPVFERVRGLEPDDPVAVYQLARANYGWGEDLAAAEEGFKAYIAAEDRPDKPEVASAHWRLALVYERQGRYAEAMAELDEAIRLDPEHVMAVESKERLGTEHP
ncbi:MAG: tetratricopeptide repeat protein [Candidatus Eisenbacteria bacterium]|nr:tetratricopeptide repeat protein [Candidatus Eisenbacteria bacterium]